MPALLLWTTQVREAVEAMKDGEIVLLENTRYRAEETKNGEEFSKDLASLADVFVNDAFGTAHRAHCSNVGVTQYIDTCVVGYLMQKEIDFLGKAVETPVRPFVAILGGAKVADKLNVISNLLEKCDTLIIGGGMAYTFLKAKGMEVGASLVDDTKLDYCKEMIAKAESLGKTASSSHRYRYRESVPEPHRRRDRRRLCRLRRYPGGRSRTGYRTEDRRSVCRSCKDSQDSCMERTDGRIREPGSCKRNNRGCESSGRDRRYNDHRRRRFRSSSKPAWIRR